MSDDDYGLALANAVLAKRGLPFNELIRIAQLDPATDFRHANLAGMPLYQADLRGFDLTGTDLRGTGFLSAKRNQQTKFADALLDPFDAEMLPRLAQPPKVNAEAFIDACVASGWKCAELKKRGFDWKDALAAHPHQDEVIVHIGKLDDLTPEVRLAVFRLGEESGCVGARFYLQYTFFITDRRVCDVEDGEAVYRRAVAHHPKNAPILGNFAWFMDTWRKDMAEAERLYREALAVDPKHARNLANFASFMEDVRKDMAEAERLYREALAVDPKDARNLASFAVFTRNVRQDMAEAERLYREATAVDPVQGGFYANFMHIVRGDIAEAERLYRGVLAADPNHGNTHGNYARLLIATGREGEAEAHIDASLLHAKYTEDPLRLECWFYRYAVYPQWRDRALAEVSALLGQGVRSPGWELSDVVARAKTLGHPDPERLEQLAKAIAE